MSQTHMDPIIASEEEPFLGDIEEDEVELGSSSPRRRAHSRNDDPSTIGLSSSQDRPSPDQIWQRFLDPVMQSLQRDQGTRRYSQHEKTAPERSGKNRRARDHLLRLMKYTLIFFGIIQITNLLLNIAIAFSHNRFDDSFFNWHNDDKSRSSTQWPTDATADIVPVRCHSHNDYWRKIPVRSAIAAGCTGIEADVWLLKGDLYVGHNPASLTKERTFTSLYIQPLMDILAKQNPITPFHSSIDVPPHGVFDTDTEQSLVLLIDFKTNGNALWPVVSRQLEPLRRSNYLTSFDGEKLTSRAITVVVTGNAPFEKVIANTTYRDMFFDAPLRKMASLASRPPARQPITYDPTEELAFLGTITPHTDNEDVNPNLDQGQGNSGHTPQSPLVYSPFNSYYASTSLKEAIGIPMPYLSAGQRQALSDQIAGAHSLGLQVRYWETPAWPVSWRNYMWRELVKLGIDFLNVDDLDGAAKGDWRSVGGFGKSIWGTGQW